MTPYRLLKFPAHVPIVAWGNVRFAKPDSDLFLEAGKQLNVPMSRCVIVGNSGWDLLAARRASALSIGLIGSLPYRESYGQDELERVGTYRVYQDPADPLRHLDKVGLRLASKKV